MSMYVAAAAVVLLVGAGILSHLRERRIVREGHCGLPWASFDTDSQGGVGIKCQRCGASTWVSWHSWGVCVRKWT